MFVMAPARSVHPDAGGIKRYNARAGQTEQRRVYAARGPRVGLAVNEIAGKRVLWYLAAMFGSTVRSGRKARVLRTATGE
jgi:hypothetical protein